MMWTSSVVVGTRRLGGREHLVGIDERAELMERFTDQQPGLGCHAVEHSRRLQPFDLHESPGRTAPAGRPEQQPWVGRAGCLQPRVATSGWILPPAGPAGIDAISVLQQEPAP